MIETVCEEEPYEDGEIIIAEGATNDKFFILIDGTVQIWKKFQQPDQELLTVYSQGRMFGELALIEDLPRSATVAAKGPVRLLAVKRERFQSTDCPEPSVCADDHAIDLGHHPGAHRELY